MRKCSRLKKCTCKMLTAFLTAGLLAGFPAMALSAREAIPAQGQEESVVEGTKSAIRDFFRDMGESIRSFFARLFS